MLPDSVYSSCALLGLLLTAFRRCQSFSEENVDRKTSTFSSWPQAALVVRHSPPETRYPFYTFARRRCGVWVCLRAPGDCPGARTFVGCAVGGVPAFPAAGAVVSLSLRATSMASAVTCCPGGVLVSCRCSALVAACCSCRRPLPFAAWCCWPALVSRFVSPMCVPSLFSCYMSCFCVPARL